MPKRLEPLRHQPCKDCKEDFPVYHRFQERCEPCQVFYRNTRQKTYRKTCKTCDTIFVTLTHRKTECPTCAAVSVCKCCGDKFEKTSYQNTYFCSERCRNVYKSELYFGGNYIATLERDSYSCRKCGSKNHPHVHHIDFSGRFKKTEPEKCNNNLDNLLTLCNACHQTLHTEVLYLLVQSHVEEVVNLTSEFMEDANHG